MHEGILIGRSDGRYGLEDGFYFTSGDYMEYYDEDCKMWFKGRVEYSNGYYWTDDESVYYLFIGMLVRG